MRAYAEYADMVWGLSSILGLCVLRGREGSKERKIEVES